MPNRPKRLSQKSRKNLINNSLLNPVETDVKVFNIRRLKSLFMTNLALNNRVSVLSSNNNVVLEQPILNTIYFLLNENVNQLIGIKKIGRRIILASDCVFDSDYNYTNHRDYFAYINIFVYPPDLDNVLLFKTLNNDDIVLKITCKSRIFKFNTNITLLDRLLQTFV